MLLFILFLKYFAEVGIIYVEQSVLKVCWFPYLLFSPSYCLVLFSSPWLYIT